MIKNWVPASVQDPPATGAVVVPIFVGDEVTGALVGTLVGAFDGAFDGDLDGASVVVGAFVIAALFVGAAEGLYEYAMDKCKDHQDVLSSSGSSMTS